MRASAGEGGMEACNEALDARGQRSPVTGINRVAGWYDQTCILEASSTWAVGVESQLED